MVGADLDETVAVYLAAVDGEPAPEPADRSIPAMSDALGVESVSDRVALLSTLDDMASRGLVDERTATVEGRDGERLSYDLTEAGRAFARRVRDRVAGETVTVQGPSGEREAVPVGRLDEHLDAPALARGLARLTDDGVVYLSDDVDGGLVDREPERAALADALDAVTAGEGRAVLLSGAAGVGKTTLATELLVELASDRDCRTLIGQCREAPGEPYGPIKEALSEHLGSAEASPFDRPGPDPEDADAYAAQREALFEDVASLVASVGQERPTVLVLEDLHLAADPTADLFVHLAQAAGPGLLVVGTVRADVAPGTDDGGAVPVLDEWSAAVDGTHLALEPFDREATAALVTATVGRPDVPAAFVDAVYERTAGNPLFVTEVVEHALDAGVVDPDHGVYPEDAEAIQPTGRLSAAVERRLAALDETTRSVLETAAVAGGAVPLSVLSRAVALPRAQLNEHVDALVDGGVWARDGDTVRFTSGLVREIVVDELSEQRAADRHATVADAVADGDESAGAVASHRLAAGQHERAFDALLSAADAATDEYAHELALTDYESALEVARDHLGYDEDDATVVEVLERIAEVYYTLGEYEEADKYYGYVEERLSDPETCRRIARIRADMLDSFGLTERARDVADDAVDEYGIDDTRESGLLLGRRGAERGKLGEREAEREDYERLREIGERTGDRKLRAVARVNLGGADLHWRTVDDDTLARLREAVSLAEGVEDDRTLARALNNLAMAHMRRGDLDDAQRVFERCLSVRESLGDRMALARSKRNLGRIYRRQGSFRAALATMRAVVDVAERADNVVFLAAAHEEIAEIHHALGDLDAAVEGREATLSAVRRLGQEQFVVSRTASLAATLLDRGDVDRARDLAREADEHGREIEDPVSRSRAAEVRGDVALFDGETDAARERYETGLELVAESDLPATNGTECGIRCGLAELARRRDDLESATDHCEAASDALDAEEDPRRVADLAVVRARVARTAGDHDGALTAVDDALAAAREGPTQSRVGEVAALLERTRIELDRGETDAAADSLAAARSLVDEYGIGRYDDAVADLAPAVEAAD